jgi:hypothetical protein
MCARASRPLQPIYGANDWCYSYGRSTAETILRDTDFTVELSPTGAVRPFSVIDGGWENGTAAWPDMGKLAGEMQTIAEFEFPRNLANQSGRTASLWYIYDSITALVLIATPQLLLDRAATGEHYAYFPICP